MEDQDFSYFTELCIFSHVTNGMSFILNRLEKTLGMSYLLRVGLGLKPFIPRFENNFLRTETLYSLGQCVSRN